MVPAPTSTPSPEPRSFATPLATRVVPPAPSPVPALRRYPQRKRKPTNRFGFAALALHNRLFEDKYRHHLAAFAAAPPQPVSTKAPKLPSLARLLKGPERDIWLKGTANELGRLLPNGVGASRPLSE